MSTLFDEGSPDLRYAEYVLGVLDAQARAQVEQEIARSEAAAAAVEQWRRRLLPLAEEAAPASPPPRLWQRIRAELQLEEPVRARARSGRESVRDSLRFWQGLSFATGLLLTAACVAIVVLVIRRPPAPPIPYMASTITESGGRIGWTVTMDIAKARMIVVPAEPQGLGRGRSPELWLIPHGGKPIAVGMISASAPITIELPAALLARLGPTAVLAVSAEPPGGSSTGQPTGPVLGQGGIGAAVAGGTPGPAASAALLAQPGATHV